ncbi:hypothetical protein BC567DRAFT_59275 [Phyllosticta citribraziliensis]
MTRSIHALPARLPAQHRRPNSQSISQQDRDLTQPIHLPNKQPAAHMCARPLILSRSGPVQKTAKLQRMTKERKRNRKRAETRQEKIRKSERGKTNDRKVPTVAAPTVVTLFHQQFLGPLQHSAAHRSAATHSGGGPSQSDATAPERQPVRQTAQLGQQRASFRSGASVARQGVRCPAHLTSFQQRDSTRPNPEQKNVDAAAAAAASSSHTTQQNAQQ